MRIVLIDWKCINALLHIDSPRLEPLKNPYKTQKMHDFFYHLFSVVIFFSLLALLNVTKN